MSEERTTASPGAEEGRERESSPPPASLRNLPASSERLIGTVVDGRYVLTREIGRGGICAVFLAEHRYTRRHYALKTLLPDYRTHREARSRLLAEARLLGAVHHPNVVEVVDAGMDHEGSPFVVMERLRAKSVDALLVARGKLTIHDALTIARLTAKALAAVHRARVVHRDVKPGNLLVVRTDSGKTLKLIDFGVATFHEVRVEDDEGPPSTIVGTPYYMAPEYVSGKKATPAVDIYSFGATLFECLTGQVPFSGSFEQVYARAMTAPRPDVMRLRPDAPPALAQLVATALATDPNDRYPSGAELCAALEGISEAGPETSAPNLDTSRRGHVRVPYHAPIEIRLPNGDVVEGAVEDLSVGGLLVTTRQSVPPQSEVLLRFPLPSGLIVVGSAVVRWAREAHSSTALGLELTQLDHSCQQAIAEYVRTVE